MRSAIRALILALALAPAVRAADAARAAESALVFYSAGKEVDRVTAAQMRERPDARIVDVADPSYGRRKRLRAVPLRGLLTTAYGGTWAEDMLSEVFFESLDGSLSHARTGELMAEGGWLAFDDAEVPGWEERPGKRTRPGPFYLFWTGGAQRPRNGFPWPEQIASMRRGMIEEEYPKAVPRGAAPGSAAARGWKVYRKDCLSCHAMSGQGGAVGPDLNEPKGVTRFHAKRPLKAYIKKASAFRHTKMPDFDELTPADLDDLTAYFDHTSELAGTK